LLLRRSALSVRIARTSYRDQHDSGKHEDASQGGMLLSRKQLTR
jgi:hypothetical protein